MIIDHIHRVFWLQEMHVIKKISVDYYKYLNETIFFKKLIKIITGIYLVIYNVRKKHQSILQRHTENIKALAKSRCGKFCVSGLLV